MTPQSCYGAGCVRRTASDHYHDENCHPMSWPDLFRPSMSLLLKVRQDVDAWHKAGHDGVERWEACYSAAMRIAGLSISARHLARLSPSGSTSAAVRALAIASTARASGISPASAGRITRASMAR